MKLTHVTAQNVLSLAHAEAEFNDRLTVFIGPNGAGKTNIIRALTVGIYALDWLESRGRQHVGVTTDPARIALRSFAEARCRATAPGVPQRVVIGLVLGDQDREDLACFMRAAVLSTVLAGVQGHGGGQDAAELAEWAEARITPKSLADIACGELVLQHEGSADGPWQVSWEFESGGSRCQWRLTDPGGDRTAIAPDTPGVQATGASYLPLWKALGNSDDRVAAEFAVPADFGLGALFRQDGQPVEAPTIHAGGGRRLEPDLRPHREFAAMARIELWTQVTNRAYSLGWLLRRVLQRGLLITGEQFRGIAGPAPLPPSGRYSMYDLALGVRGFDPSTLPVRLFRLKNGSIEDQAHFRRIQRLFTQFAPGRLVELSFEVTLTERAETEEEPTRYDADSSVTVLVSHEDEHSDESLALPIQMCGAGTWEALVLAEALAGPDDRVVILDEPAMNLHPGWQQLLLAHLRDRAGQSVIITHSPYLLPLQDENDINRLVRVSRQDGRTTLSKVRGPLADPRGVLRDYSLSADARAMLLASGVVLVEGETELGALPLWFAKSEAAAELGTPLSRHLAFYSVGSETHFKAPLTLLAALGIPWVIVADAGPLRPDAGRNHIFRQVAAAGAASPELDDWVSAALDDEATDARLKFREVADEARRHGIFTLAPSWSREKNEAGVTAESFEAFVEGSPGLTGQLAAARAEVGNSKVRQGRWLAETHPCPAAVSALYKDIIQVLQPEAQAGKERTPSLTAVSEAIEVSPPRPRF